MGYAWQCIKWWWVHNQLVTITTSVMNNTMALLYMETTWTRHEREHWHAICATIWTCYMYYLHPRTRRSTDRRRNVVIEITVQRYYRVRVCGLSYNDDDDDGVSIGCGCGEDIPLGWCECGVVLHWMRAIKCFPFFSVSVSVFGIEMWLWLWLL